MTIPPHYDPEVTREDIRSIKRFFRALPGKTSKIVSIRYLGPDRFDVKGPYQVYIIVRDVESGWRIVEEGWWIA